jgi:lipid-A-disaccharide synthase
MSSVLIVAGEKSGENYGAAVVRAVRDRRPGTEFFGVGGRAMAEAGVEVLVPMEALAVMGLAEVVTELPRIKRVFDRLRREVEARRPAAAVLIDSPDFNLRLAKRLKALGVPVLYYISPTVWAWRRGRLRTIRKVVRKMLLIFPFEAEIYEREGIPHRFVGHPLLERVRVRFGRDEFFARYRLDPGRPLVALLPGSRRGEVIRHLPALVGAAAELRSRRGAQFVLVQAEGLEDGLLKSDLLGPAGPEIRVLREDGYEAVASSDLALSASGTANLEAALLGTPLIAFYRISPLTYAIGRPFVRLRNYSIVNILAGRRVVPELIQGGLTAGSLAAEADRLLGDAKAREDMRAAFQAIRISLGNERASENAAGELVALL